MGVRGHVVARSASRSSVTRRTWSTMSMCNILILSVSLMNSVSNHSGVNLHLISINSEFIVTKKGSNMTNLIPNSLEETTYLGLEMKNISPKRSTGDLFNK
jgi:hypothetical protein